MTLDYHKVTDEAFHALAAGGGGGAAVSSLASAQYSKHLLLIRGVVKVATDAGHPHATWAREGYDLLAGVQAESPEAVDGVLRHPAVGAWAWRTLRALHADGRAAAQDPARLCSVAAAAAIAAGTRCAIAVPAEGARVMLPSLGQVVLPAGADRAHVSCDGGAATVTVGGFTTGVPMAGRGDTPHWQALRRLSATAGGLTITLIVDDLDPFRMPGGRVTGHRLAEQELAVWRSHLWEAWAVLAEHHRTTAEELTVASRVLTPLASTPGDQISGSSREAFGCVALSTPENALAFGVTLAHEIQHAKLSALLDVVPLLLSDDGRRYYAPWRSDPRPLGGLLQGAYAFLGVSGYLRRQRFLEQGDTALHMHAEFSRWRTAAESVVDLIAESGRLTDRGKLFVAGMGEMLRSWRDDPVPADATARGRAEAARHLAEWRARNAM
ncbi:HEXXH motif domain-containing protein [Streptosporangium sp. KLBMP 9127]|nr:HEXXH motif domain-containing protein [Streptosporangium sp. KLBMP 9127]